MRIKNLFYLLLALPMLMVACEESTVPVDEVKNPTIELTAGEATEFTLSFTINTTEATDVAWLVIEASEATPTASEVLANGTKIEANKSVECKATALEDGTEYTVVAVVKNSKAVDKKEIKMTTIAATEETTQFKRKSEAEIEVTAGGGKGEIEYEIINPIEGTEVEATADVVWITVTAGEKIAYIVEGNTSEEPREGKITATYGDLSFEVKVKQAAKEQGDNPGEEVNFTASVYEVYYYGTQYSSAYNYQVFLSDNGLNENGNFKQNGEYYMLDMYAADSAENNKFTLPNGKYTASDTSNAGTFGIGDYGAHIKIVDGVPTYSLYKQGTVTVTDGKIEAKIMMEDGTIHNVLFEGNLRFDGKEDNPDNPDQPVGATHVANKWLWGGSSSYGNKYQVIGEGFSVDVHFPAKYATESSLAEGEYIWTNTSWWGYNDFENEFTTRSFTVNGTSVAVDSGSAKVAVKGEEYAIQFVLDGRDGVEYIIEYNGKLNNKEEIDNSEIVLTSLSKGTHNNTYGFFTYKAANDKVNFDLLVNDSQSEETTIQAGDYTYAPMKEYVGNKGFFYVDNFKLDGIKYKSQASSTMNVTNNGTNVSITLKLIVDSGDEIIVTYNGTLGEGGNTPAEPTKLATPSVSGLVSGNAATISWQDVAGAKDYSVSLNGTYINTVETAYIVLSDLKYSTTYSVAVVANPADTTVNSASDAGTASFTTEADPNGGGEQPENPGDGGDDDEWGGREVKLMLLAYQDNTVYARVNNESIYIMTNFRNGIVAGKFNLAGDNKSEDILLAGHATSQIGLFGSSTSFTDGDTVEVIDNGGGSYTIVYRVDINGDKITATYTGGLE